MPTVFQGSAFLVFSMNKRLITLSVVNMSDTCGSVSIAGLRSNVENNSCARLFLRVILVQISTAFVAIVMKPGLSVMKALFVLREILLVVICSFLGLF